MFGRRISLGMGVVVLVSLWDQLKLLWLADEENRASLDPNG